MTFQLKFTFCADTEAESFISDVSKITKDLTDVINADTYGDDISVIGIHIICVRVRPGYEKFFKVNKPEFMAEYKYVKPLEGEVTIKGYFSYEIQFSQESYEQLLKADYNHVKKIIENELISSLGNLSKIPKKIKDFNEDKFCSKFKAFFKLE
ncbi:hypothetical protein [Aliikangiella maris]|uniref:Uncharacterized protein n=2 Tax=Aliikangiella maris TaxID=3162458 RepID=A0ABV2C182_9GAMM